MSASPVAFITGGATGIGAATAKRLLADGYLVAVTARGHESLKRFAEQVGDPASLLTLQSDTSDPAQVEKAVDATVERFGRLDLAIASAGFATSGNVADGDPAQWREMVLTNVLGPALVVKAVLPRLSRTRGRIILV